MLGAQVSGLGTEGAPGSCASPLPKAPAELCQGSLCLSTATAAPRTALLPADLLEAVERDGHSPPTSPTARAAHKDRYVCKRQGAMAGEHEEPLCHRVEVTGSVPPCPVLACHHWADCTSLWQVQHQL